MHFTDIFIYFEGNGVCMLTIKIHLFHKMSQNWGMYLGFVSQQMTPHINI